MIRFPNPGSNIDNFINIYKELFYALKDREQFNLDDITLVLIARNLAASSGFVGELALERSYRTDRSRDPLYNQSKMYSELYKILGWLHPTSSSALNFTFTYLGAHIASADYDTRSLVKECILGIAYPNQILDVKHNHISRPFLTILRTINDLGGQIYRDEMIIGPMSLVDDRSSTEYSDMIRDIKNIRGDKNKLEAKMDEFSESLGIAENTMKNYTRFPLGILDWTNWITEEHNSNIYGTRLKFRVLTDPGRKKISELKKSKDIRVADLEEFEIKERNSLIRIGFYQMMERSGFDISVVEDQLSADKEIISGKLDHKYGILFSPFQELSSDSIGAIFPRVTGTQSISQAAVTTSKKPDEQIYTILKFDSSHQISDVKEEYIADIPDIRNIDKLNLMDELEEYIVQFREYNQDRFYPLIASLFRMVGFDCKDTRAGVNYERWDAFIYHESNSIPIEIKSPGEEEFISIKAIRQAVENKIILLSREAFPTTFITTTLVVGYSYPNDRSEVMNLISDVYRVFGIVIGVIDIKTLIYLVANAYYLDKKYSMKELKVLHGFLETEIITSKD